MPTPLPISSLSPLLPPPLPSCYKAIILHYIILLLLLLLYLICRYNIFNYFCHIGQILARCIYMRDIKISIYLSFNAKYASQELVPWLHKFVPHNFLSHQCTRH